MKETHHDTPADGDAPFRGEAEAVALLGVPNPNWCRRDPEIWTQKRLPESGVDCTPIVPSCTSTMALAIASPGPDPPPFRREREALPQ